VTLILVHHGEAEGPEVDPRRPLTPAGRLAVERLAAAAALHGARPDIVWHSGKLRARQTAEAFWRACNALATFSATRDLQPNDPPERLRDRLVGESRDLLVAGHFPHLPRLLTLLVGDEETAAFPLHGAVALEPAAAMSWRELWRLDPQETTR
jgi:phosphohistidine phosphatase